MRFALLGDHPDGLAAARALAATGRHELIVYSGPPEGRLLLERWDLRPVVVGDLEEILADPAVAAVIVGGSISQRLAQLRRVLQSERHALCVHPVADSPDAAYEAALLQAEMGVALLPLLPEAFHPAFQLLKSWMGPFPEAARALPPPLPANVSVPRRDQDKVTILPDRPLSQAIEAAAARPVELPLLAGPLRLLEIQRSAEEEVLLEAGGEDPRPGLPGWDVVRLLGGEIGEILALSTETELDRHQPLLVNGRFMAGGLLQATLLPDQAEARYQVKLTWRGGWAEVIFPEGMPGPARLESRDDLGRVREETWEALDPWPPLVAAFERAVAGARRPAPAAVGVLAPESWTTRETRLGWADAWRGLELDLAVRRSVLRRRSSTLDHQEATEEASFKGAMTLVGCSLLWVSLLLLILSVWLPWLGWVILPVFAIFLGMQALRWVVPETAPGSKGQNDQV